MVVRDQVECLLIIQYSDIPTKTLSSRHLLTSFKCRSCYEDGIMSPKMSFNLEIIFAE